VKLVMVMRATNQWGAWIGIDICGKALRRGGSRRARDSMMAQQGQSHAQWPVVNEARLVEWMEDWTHERAIGRPALQRDQQTGAWN
jgi:hypothetical protein